jgi:hypothetical protein
LDITLGKRAIKIISNSNSCIFFRHDDLLQFAYAICTSIIVFFFSYAEKEISCKKESFKKHGKTVEYFSGVEQYFTNINEYAKNKSIKLEHYIISSGTKEMIEGTSIAKEFEAIFASSFKYNVDGVAQWPALAINYTTKTQYLFRI